MPAFSAGDDIGIRLLPTALDLDADVIRVVASGVAQGITDHKIILLDRKRGCSVYGPVEPHLAVAAGIESRPPCGIGHCNVRDGVNCVCGGLAPLRCNSDQELHRWFQLKRERWLDMNEVRVGRVTAELKIITVRKQWIECPKGLFGVAVTGRRVELDAQPWAPFQVGEGVASE